MSQYIIEDIEITIKTEINKIDHLDLTINLLQGVDDLSHIILELSNIQYFELCNTYYILRYF